MEGRRVSRLVASAVRPHPALAVHLARGQVGQGVGPVLDASCEDTEVLTGCAFLFHPLLFRTRVWTGCQDRVKESCLGQSQGHPMSLCTRSLGLSPDPNTTLLCPQSHWSPCHDRNHA